MRKIERKKNAKIDRFQHPFSFFSELHSVFSGCRLFPNHIDCKSWTYTHRVARKFASNLIDLILDPFSAAEALCVWVHCAFQTSTVPKLFSNAGLYLQPETYRHPCFSSNMKRFAAFQSPQCTLYKWKPEEFFSLPAKHKDAKGGKLRKYEK